MLRWWVTSTATAGLADRPRHNDSRKQTAYKNRPAFKIVKKYITAGE